MVKTQTWLHIYRLTWFLWIELLSYLIVKRLYKVHTKRETSNFDNWLSDVFDNNRFVLTFMQTSQSYENKFTLF